MAMTQQPILAVTMGYPFGIGGEVFLKSWLVLQQQPSPPLLLLIDDPIRVKQLIAFLDLAIIIAPSVPHPMPLTRDQLMGWLSQHRHQLVVLPPQTTMAAKANNPLPAVAFHIGPPTSMTQKIAGGMASLAAIDTAVDLAQKKIIDAVITAPIDKSAIAATMVGFTGHTEYLKERDHQQQVVMMMAHQPVANHPSTAAEKKNNANQQPTPFRTVPLTTHIALQDVAKKLTAPLIETSCRLVARSLQQQFAIAKPRLAMAALNPHAGEDGTMGREEIEIITPAIKKLQAEGMDIKGPLPADSLFTPQHRARFDVFLCPSHDQALIPIKTLFFDSAVNVTLGLSFIRTSPDHGTATDMAPHGAANPAAMLSAIALAQQLSLHQPTH